MNLTHHHSPPDGISTFTYHVPTSGYMGANELNIATLNHLKGNGWSKKPFPHVFNCGIITALHENVLRMSKIILSKKL